MYYYPEDEDDVNIEFVEEPIIRPSTPGSLASKRTFRDIMKDNTRPVALFGAVPPPLKLGEEIALKAAESLAKTFADLKPDAVIVYDIQDEKSRNGGERPFPFSQTFDPRNFSKLLHRLSNLEVIVYQALTPERTEETFRDYVNETMNEFGIKNVVFVGGPGCPLNVPEASRLALRFSEDIVLGGVTIAERHRDQKTEHERVFEKCGCGVSFFTSQVVYNADNMIAFLRDYNELCQQRSVQPARIMLAFAPFGRKETLDFLRWLGVEVAEGTASRVLNRGTPQLRIDESVQICRENFRRILDAYRLGKWQIPLGIAVESVSKYRDEQKAAEDLFKLLREDLTHFYLSSS